MDFLKLLLMHLPTGLALDSDDLVRLEAADRYSCESVVDAAASFEARRFLAVTPAWADLSEQKLKVSEKYGIRWCTFADSQYPQQWKALSFHPPIFSYRGEPAWLAIPMIAVVGSRTPARTTLNWMQRELSHFLRIREVGVVSGGARGIDQWAHKISMECNRPTVAILPSGLLNPYPIGMDPFWQEIVDKGGCVLSTCGLNAKVSRDHFQTRNRWIAGMSPMCFVAEANRRSGSLLTARLAIEEQRTLCTLPVFPMAEQGLGNLDLLTNGAIMLRDHRDLTALWDVESLGDGFPTIFAKPPQD